MTAGAAEREKLARVQFAPPPEVVDLGPGVLGSDLIPSALLAEAARAAVGDPDSFAYGPEAGPRELLAALPAHIGKHDHTAPDPTEIVVTAGASHALDMACGVLSRPGDAVLVERRTYDRALRIFTDRGLLPVPFSPDSAGEGGPGAAIARLYEQGRRAAFMYVVPTFHNPTGRSMSVTERVRLVALAEGLEVPIVEDDVYRELYYDSPPPPSLWSLAANRARGDGARVLRVGSFSKWVAPGLRVGWLSLRAEDARAVRESGLLWSGGGIAHLSGSVVGHALASGALDAHADWVRAALCERRDALVTALAGRLRGGFELEPPGGGYFAWLRGPASVNLARLIDEAARRKVCFYPGERFGAQPGTIELRLAFPYYPPSQLAAGAASLADAIDLTLEETG